MTDNIYRHSFQDTLSIPIDSYSGALLTFPKNPQIHGEKLWKYQILRVIFNTFNASKKLSSTEEHIPHYTDLDSIVHW